MLVIYHFYEWTWSFCYCAYSNTFLSSLSSLYLSFDCITIINLLHIEIVCFLYYPYYLFVAGSHLSGKKIIALRSVVGMIKILKHKSLFTKTQFAKGLKIRERSWKKKFLAVTLVHEEDWEMWLKNKNFCKKTNEKDIFITYYNIQY